MKKMIATAAALLLSAPLFAADVSIQELQQADGDALIVVKQVLANCDRGEPHVLFSDNVGAVMKVQDLAHIDNLLNGRVITVKGGYRNLHVVLDGDAFVANGEKVQHVALERGIGGTVVKLNGELRVSKNFAGSRGFTVEDASVQLAQKRRFDSNS